MFRTLISLKVTLKKDIMQWTLFLRGHFLSIFTVHTLPMFNNNISQITTLHLATSLNKLANC